MMKPVIKGNKLIDADTGEVLVRVMTKNKKLDQSIIEYALYRIDDEEWFKQCVIED